MKAHSQCMYFTELPEDVRSNPVCKGVANEGSCRCYEVCIFILGQMSSISYFQTMSSDKKEIGKRIERGNIARGINETI